ncbi:cystatin-13-like [Nannospalax galili]|uniref:Cystatin 13 n=1 Tax=Nannospalax galili TaxID=1026970 RepID=A0A8C6RS91_NANGA|nr:cystatin-13-like [Nannospalax galili]
MARLFQGLLFLVVTVALVSRRVQAWGTTKVVRPFVDISKTYIYVQQALWYAMKEYNVDSKDQYNFKVMDILKAQEQLTDSLEYYLEVKIARTMCKKISGDNANCLFQQDPQMKKIMLCTFIVRSKPWRFELKLLKKQCQDA